MMKDERLFTDEQEEALVMALARGKETLTEDEAQKVFDWASRVTMEAAMLDMIFSGRLVITEVKDDGDLMIALPNPPS